jgi:sulfofructose kinase
MENERDILGLGCVAVDDLLYVPSFPIPDGKIRIDKHERQCGGLAATALVAAARLGSRCSFAGDLGQDELSSFVRTHLNEEGVDTSLLRAKEGVKPIHSIVIVDKTRLTRTVLYDLEGSQGPPNDWPPESAISLCKVLIVDHFGVEGMTRAARIARRSGVPVVADFESSKQPGFSELLELVDHLILSFEFAASLTGLTKVNAMIAALWSDDRSLVAITKGLEGCWFRSQDGGQTVQHQPSFSVPVLDTTGCGDVFHGAYASALTRPGSTQERIRFASAAAALKCTSCGGQLGIPRREAVETFLKEHGV